MSDAFSIGAYVELLTRQLGSSVYLWQSQQEVLGSLLCLLACAAYARLTSHNGNRRKLLLFISACSAAPMAAATICDSAKAYLIGK